jgi:hypothetical protein
LFLGSAAKAAWILLNFFFFSCLQAYFYFSLRNSLFEGYFTTPSDTVLRALVYPCWQGTSDERSR